MVDGTRVTDEDLKRVAKKFSDANQDIQGTMKTLRGQVESLRGSWKGEGAHTFDAVMGRFDQDVFDLNQKLLETSEAIDKSRTNYSAAEQENVQRLSSLPL